MGTREGVVVLVVAADRRTEALGQLPRGVDRAAEHDAGAIQDHREFRLGKQCRGAGDRVGTARRTLQLDRPRQLDIDHLRPVVARHVDLRRRRAAPGVFDDAVQYLGNARRVANFFLVADAVFEHRHLLDFLETTLFDGLVSGLRGHQQQRRMVPAAGTRVAVGDHARVALVRAIPELDSRLREQVRDRHHRRTDNAEGMFDSVHLQYLDKGFFGSHFHRVFSWNTRSVSILTANSASCGAGSPVIRCAI